jgi:hypothetical protein
MPFLQKLVDSLKGICRDNEHLNAVLNAKSKRWRRFQNETFISLDQQIDRQIQL